MVCSRWLLFNPRGQVRPRLCLLSACNPKETPRTISVVAGTTTQPKEIPRTIRVAAGTRPQVTNTDVEEAIPVGEEATSLRAEELEKWHKLFQSGAITQAEYESEKEKILHHI